MSLLARSFPMRTCGFSSFNATGQKSQQKIATCLADTGRPLLFPNDPDIIAIATDEDELACDQGNLPRLSINDPVAIAGFVLNRIARDRRLKPDVAC